MKGRLSARLEKLERRIPRKPYICRQLIIEPGESRLALDRMVADGEIDNSQRGDVFFIAITIVEPKRRDVPQATVN